MRRREFVKTSLFAAAAASNPKLWSGKAPFFKKSTASKKVIVLGFDGMDPVLTRRFMDEGVMPAFSNAISRGFQFGELETVMPPQSPVAWSTFITGTNPGGHGIFDFVHRDPAAFLPYMSSSRSFDPTSSIKLGDWVLPLGGGKVELMRKGRPFWSVLNEHGIYSSTFQIPANFPVDSIPVHAVSGMGTPDLRGSYGTFTLFSDAPSVPQRSQIEGGLFIRVAAEDHHYKLKLEGPSDPFHAKGATANIDIDVFRDPWEKVIRVVLPDQELILKQGEWSEWLPLSFKLLPLFASVSGMVRLYVKEVHPHFQLYVSPINVDPMNPSLPICSPAGYSRELSEAVGRFYTQGFPADSSALSSGALSDDEYLAQSKIVLEENERMFHYQLERFREGLFFFYFSSIDQNSHMLWRTFDPSHPLYNPNASAEVKNALRFYYTKMDSYLQAALNRVDSSTTLIALSDHGFAPFYREFHLSSWLVENGFTVLQDPEGSSPGEFYDRVDWTKTKAYALGINGIYLNLAGREVNGSLSPARAAEVKREIIAKLRLLTDPVDGRKVLVEAYDTSELYQGPFLALAPDIVVGYQRGFRISDEAALGKFPKEMIGNRTNKWAADHCIDPSVVPGLLLTNHPWAFANPGLRDMAPTILRSFGLDPLPEMEGKPLLV